MRLTAYSLFAASMCAVAFAQESAPPEDSPFWTAFVTWLPFLMLIGLWLFFMRKMGGKKGYASYMASSQERLASMDDSLKRIATSLERLSEKPDPE